MPCVSTFTNRISVALMGKRKAFHGGGYKHSAGDCVACGKAGWLDPGDGCFWSCVFLLVLFRIPVWLVSF